MYNLCFAEIKPLFKPDNYSDIVGEMRNKIEEKTQQRTRKKRAADPTKTTLDLAEKSEYTYRLTNDLPNGLKFAHDSVDEAFQSWSNAIGTAVTFSKTVKSS